MAEIPSPSPLTIAAIYDWHESNRRDFESDGIPFSTLGDECNRKIWYAFRWVHAPEKKHGRMLRLFETGNREEARMIDELRAIGCEVTGEQQKVSLCRGHLRGKIDGVVTGLIEAPKTPHLLECKTHKGESWRAVVKHGLKAKKCAHWVQVMLGMHALGLTRGFYEAHNKDTDELHTDRIEYDPLASAQLEARATRLIEADNPPAKLHEDPSKKGAWNCAQCPAKGVCHEGEQARRTCRSCLHSEPTDNAGWLCARFSKPLSRNEQKLGCPYHRFLPGLVNGIQEDADAEAETVTYHMADGSHWVDEGSNA